MPCPLGLWGTNSATAGSRPEGGHAGAGCRAVLCLAQGHQAAPSAAIVERRPLHSTPAGDLADGWKATDRSSFYRVQKLPLPTPEDRLFFLLTSLKTYTLQVVHGRLFGKVQGKCQSVDSRPLARAAGRPACPQRCPCSLPHGSGEAARRLRSQRGHYGHAVGGGFCTHGRRPPSVPVSPLVPMTARNGVSSTPKIFLNRRTIIVGRKRTTR